MERIYKLIRNVRTAELNGIISIIIKAYLNAIAKLMLTADNVLKQIFDELTELNRQLAIALEKERLYSNLKAFDTQRDNAFRSFHSLIKGFLSLTDHAIYPAVQRVFAILDKYGVASTNQAYDTQTGLFNSLMEELAAEETQNAISAITYASEKHEALVEAHQNFINEYAAYRAKVNESKSQKSASDLVPEVLDVLNNKLVGYLRTMSNVDADTYGSFTDEIALTINQANQTIKERAAKNEE